MNFEQIKTIFGIRESHELYNSVMETVIDKEKREKAFQEVEAIESLDHDCFVEFFQDELASRKQLKQDYTPDCLCDIVGRLANGSQIMDVCAGIGGLTQKAFKHNQEATFYCDELSSMSLSILLFNLSIRGINAIVRQHDVLNNRTEKVYKLTKNGKYSDIEEVEEVEIGNVDTVIMNPPYSLRWDNVRDFMYESPFSYFGFPPEKAADYGFILRGVEKLNDKGTLIAIVPHGVLFRGNREGSIRKVLAEENMIDAIIGLPENMFQNTGIPVCLMILKKGRTEKDILFIDASKEFKKEAKVNVLKENHIEKIVSVYKNRLTVDKFSRKVEPEEIEKNDYNLNIPRYVDTFEDPPEIDLKETIDEIYKIEDEIAKVNAELALMMAELEGGKDYAEQKERLIGNLTGADGHSISKALGNIDKVVNCGLFASGEYVKVLDLCEFERSKRKKIYPAGCILVQLSASKGQIIYMEDPAEVDAKYGVFIPNEGINARYLYQAMAFALPSFLQKYQTGLNINPEIFNDFEVKMHAREDEQKAVVQLMTGLDELIDQVENDIEVWKDVKKYHLDNMFPKG